MRLLAPLAVRPIAWLWAGLALSAIGDQLFAVALIWVSVGVFGAAAGYLSALSAAAILMAALMGGQWADRLDQRRAMLVADLLRALCLAVVMLVWIADGSPPAWGLIVAVLVLAAGQAVFRPGLQAVLPRLAPTPALLPPTNALVDSTERIARLLGPGVVGVLAGVLPTVAFLGVDALSFLASAVAVMAIRSALPRTHGRAVAGSVLAAILHGFRALRRVPLLGYVLVTSGPTNGFWFATYFLALPLAIERHGIVGLGGTGLGAYGLVISAYGVTNLMSMLIVGNREMPARPGRQMFSGDLIVGGGMVLLAIAELVLPTDQKLAGYIAAAALTAIGGPMRDIPVAVLRQTQLPAADIPAAMRAFLVVVNAGTLIGMLAAPVLIGWIGVPAVMAGCGGGIVAMGIIGLLRFATRPQAITLATDAGFNPSSD